MAKPRDPNLRPRLIHAAGREFADKGFGAASIDRIGSVAGVTKGGVYFHFRSKEDLFFAVVEHWRDAHRALLAAAAEPDASGGLRGFLASYLQFHFDHPEVFGLLRVLASEMRGRFTTQVREDHQATLRAVRARIRELVMQESHEGTLFASDPSMLTFVLAAAVEGVISLVSVSPPDTVPFRHPESIVDFLLAPYETRRAHGTERTGAPAVQPEGLDFLPPVKGVEQESG